MKNTNWNIIQAGQLVRFLYRNMKGESSQRTAYVLAPRYRYRKQSTKRIVEFFIGLEIENNKNIKAIFLTHAQGINGLESKLYDYIKKQNIFLIEGLVTFL